MLTPIFEVTCSWSTTRVLAASCQSTYCLNSAPGSSLSDDRITRPQTACRSDGAETSMQDMCVLHWDSPGCLGERPWLVDGFGTCWQNDLNERSTKETASWGQGTE